MTHFTIDDRPPADSGHTGEAILARACAFAGKEYVLWGRLDLSDDTHTGPWDCSELCSWTLFQTTGILFGVAPKTPIPKANAYTKLWGEEAEERGCTIPVQDALRIPGAYLLRKPRWFVGGHIAISDGEGGTMEARSRDYGVGRWDNAASRRWDVGILAPGVAYQRIGAEPALTPPPVIRAGGGSPAADVKRVQTQLHALDIYRGVLDGDFGPMTEQAVALFQHSRDIVIDGEVGAETEAKLME